MTSLRELARRDGPRRRPRTAFVLSGGGNLGAIQVGMLRALAERDIVPDVVLGCSVGALNGAGFALEPDDRGDRRARCALGGVRRQRDAVVAHPLGGPAPPQGCVAAQQRRPPERPRAAPRACEAVRGARTSVPVRRRRRGRGHRTMVRRRRPDRGDPGLRGAPGGLPARDDRRSALRRRRRGGQRADRPRRGARVPHDLRPAGRAPRSARHRDPPPARRCAARVLGGPQQPLRTRPGQPARTGRRRRAATGRAAGPALRRLRTHQRAGRAGLPATLRRSSTTGRRSSTSGDGERRAATDPAARAVAPDPTARCSRTRTRPTAPSSRVDDRTVAAPTTPTMPTTAARATTTTSTVRTGPTIRARNEGPSTPPRPPRGRPVAVRPDTAAIRMELTAASRPAERLTAGGRGMATLR